ncbi:MAG: PIG-L family deacetylase, partial [Bacteroidetes bacterium]
MHSTRLWKIVNRIAVLVLLPLALTAQAPKKWTAADIHHAIKKANVLGSALYVAAHPDDENTRMIAWLANELKVEVAYLSMTRGDGGQNLIGPEIAELLGVLRTQELLAARRIDGGAQRFTRANDFGYSKSPDETLRIWNKDAVLSDVVWAIRNWQPDIIINRFDHTGSRRTHGHHTSSAMLSYEAFDLAGDPEAFPEQLQYVQPWQPRRLFFNTSWWFYGSREAFEKADKSDMLAVDVGAYYPLLGKSNNEIAAESRSQHRCQGFGSSGSRGSQMEYLKLLKGDMPATNNPFAGIELSWRRVEGGAPVAEVLERVDRNFRSDEPWASVPDLLQALRLIEALPESHWTRIKSEEIREIIAACMGLFVDATTPAASATPGEAVPVHLEVINRSPVKAQLKAVRIRPEGPTLSPWMALPGNEPWEQDTTLLLPPDVPFTSPYWLMQPWQLGMYTVEDQRLRG